MRPNTVEDVIKVLINCSEEELNQTFTIRGRVLLIILKEISKLKEENEKLWEEITS